MYSHSLFFWFALVLRKPIDNVSLLLQLADPWLLGVSGCYKMSQVGTKLRCTALVETLRKLGVKLDIFEFCRSSFSW